MLNLNDSLLNQAEQIGAAEQNGEDSTAPSLRERLGSTFLSYSYSAVSSIYGLFSSSVSTVYQAVASDEPEEKVDMDTPEIKQLKGKLKIYANNLSFIKFRIPLLENEIERLHAYKEEIDNIRSNESVESVIRLINHYTGFYDKYYDASVKIEDDIVNEVYQSIIDSEKNLSNRLGIDSSNKQALRKALDGLNTKLTAYVANAHYPDSIRPELDNNLNAIVSYIIFSDRLEKERGFLDKDEISERLQILDNFNWFFKDANDLPAFALKFYHPDILDEIVWRTQDSIVEAEAQLVETKDTYAELQQHVEDLMNELLKKQADYQKALEDHRNIRDDVADPGYDYKPLPGDGNDYRTYTFNA